MKLAAHRNINKLDYEHFEARPGDKLVDKIIEPAYFAEVQAAITMQQTVRAMSHMHGSGVCLHDLKQEFSCCTLAPQAGGSGLPVGAGAQSSVDAPWRLSCSRVPIDWHSPGAQQLTSCLSRRRAAAASSLAPAPHPGGDAAAGQELGSLSYKR